MVSLNDCVYFIGDSTVPTDHPVHCSLWLCHAIVDLSHGLASKSDTVLEFDRDRCFSSATA